MSDLSRRGFLQETSAITAGAAAAANLNLAGAAQQARSNEAFSDHWKYAPERVWIGPEPVTLALLEKGGDELNLRERIRHSI